MKFFGWFLLVGILIGAPLVSGCRKEVSIQSKKNMSDDISDLEKLSGLKLPASTKFLSKTDEGGHDGTKYKRWIVLTAEQPTLLGTPMAGDDSKTFVETLQEAMPDEKVGNTSGTQYQFSDWKNDQGQWQAAVVETDKGFYLSLENIVLD